MTKLLNLLIVLLAAALVFVILYPQIQQGRPVVVRFACDSSVAATPLLVAVEESLFIKNKIVPELVFYSDPDSALADLFAGRVEAGVFPLSTIMRRAVDKGDTLKILVSLDYRQSLPVDAIVVPVKSKVRTIADLKGKRLIYPPQLRDYMPLFLLNSGLTAAQVNLTEVPFSTLVEKLRAGAADAAWIIEPLVCPIESTEFRILQAAALPRYVSQPFPGAALGYAKRLTGLSRVAAGRLKVSTDAAVALSATRADRAKTIVAQYFPYCRDACGFCRLPDIQRLNEINRPAIAALAVRLRAAGVLSADLETKDMFVDPATLKL
jgi:hypothetical protein